MARLLNSLVGHQGQIQKMLQAWQEKRMPSTMLLVGPEGIGKRSLALALAQIFLCSEDPVGCGECGSCLRVAKQQSEGLLVIAPEKNQIRIDQAHRILEFLSFQAVSKARIIIIDDTEYMNPQTANALLKILEEPPENTFFFLMAPSSSHVLTTIRSRSQIVHFSPLEFADLRQASRAADWMLKSAMGSFSRLKLLEDSEEIASRQNALRFLNLWLSEPTSYLSPEWRTLIKDRSEAVSLIKHILILFRDAHFLKLGHRENILNSDQHDLILKLADLDEQILQAVVSQVIKMERAILKNRDVQLLFEEFWLKSQARRAH